VIGTATPAITATDDKVSLQFSLRNDKESDKNPIFPAETIVSAFADGRGFLPHPSGVGVVELPVGWLRSHIDEVRQLLTELRESAELPPHRIPALVAKRKVANCRTACESSQILFLVPDRLIPHCQLIQPSNCEIINGSGGNG
jgi:hypothetical protein